MTVTEAVGGPPAAPLPMTGSLGGERAALRARRAGSGPGHQAVAQGLPDHRPRAASCSSELLDADEPAGTDDARSFGLRLAFARYLAPQARLGLLERRRAQLIQRLAAARARAAGRTGLDAYARSLVEHSTEATERDIAWLDRLIEAERRTADSTPSREPRAPQPGTPSQQRREPIHEHHPGGHRRRRQLRQLARPGRRVLPRRRPDRDGPGPHARHAGRLPRRRRRVRGRLRRRRRQGRPRPGQGHLRRPEQHHPVRRRGRARRHRAAGPDPRRARQVLPRDHRGVAGRAGRRGRPPSGTPGPTCS